MFVNLGQIGLGELSEEEKLEFIDYLNLNLKQEGLGAAQPVMRDQIHTNSAFEILGNTVNVIAAIQVLYAVGKSKPTRFIYDQAKSWLKSKNKDTSHMEQVERMIAFIESGDEDGAAKK